MAINNLTPELKWRQATIDACLENLHNGGGVRAVVVSWTERGEVCLSTWAPPGEDYAETAESNIAIACSIVASAVSDTDEEGEQW